MECEVSMVSLVLYGEGANKEQYFARFLLHLAHQIESESQKFFKTSGRSNVEDLKK